MIWVRIHNNCISSLCMFVFRWLTDKSSFCTSCDIYYKYYLYVAQHIFFFKFLCTLITNITSLYSIQSKFRKSISTSLSHSHSFLARKTTCGDLSPIMPRDIEGPSKDGNELDRSSRRGERASRYVKGRSKYRANWHDSHTSVDFSYARGSKRERERERDLLRNEAGVYYNEPRCIPPCVSHYILRYAYACVIASIVHESAWFMSSYEGRAAMRVGAAEGPSPTIWCE